MTRKYSSSVQYWLYAVLATRFGAALRLQRTHVSRMYCVNRHDFEAKPEWNAPGDRFAFAAEVSKFIQAHLDASGYRPAQFGGQSKRVELKGQAYELCITVRYEPEFYGVKNDTVSLSVSMHRLYA